MKRLSRVWVSQEAKKAIKIKAAQEDLSLTEFVDQQILGKKKKGGRNEKDFFF